MALEATGYSMTGAAKSIFKVLGNVRLGIAPGAGALWPVFLLGPQKFRVWR